MASPEDLDLDPEDTSRGQCGIVLGRVARPSGVDLRARAGRRELRWFYTKLRGRVPSVLAASPAELVAATRIFGWLSALDAGHRGTFVVRHDGRRWPVRLIRQFGGLTSLVVRRVAMRQSRKPTETLADAEEQAVNELLATVAEALHRPRSALAMRAAEHLRRLRRRAESTARAAEAAYFDVRGHGACVLPDASPEGA